jgi:hypothetical protein
LLDEYVIHPHDRVLFPFLPEPAQQDEPPERGDTGAEFSRAGRETGSSSPAP